MSDHHECKFDLQPLSCSECGAFIGTLGTCDDTAWCEKCNSKALRARLSNPAAHSGYDLIYSLIDADEPLQVTKERH